MVTEPTLTALKWPPDKNEKSTFTAIELDLCGLEGGLAKVIPCPPLKNVEGNTFAFLALSKGGQLIGCVEEEGNISGQVLPLIIPPDNTPIVDACFYQDRLVLVSQGGTAYSLDTEVLQDTSSLPETSFHEVVLTSPQEDGGEGGGGGQFEEAHAGSDHLILVDGLRKAWSHGTGPQTGLVKSLGKSGKKQVVQATTRIGVSSIDHFQSHRVEALSSGIDFNVAIVTRDNEEASHSTVTSTTKVAHSPNLSNKSSCPLGLPLPKPSAETSNLSTLSLTEEEEPTDEGGGGAPMAKSGLYLDPNQAIRFLSGVKSQLFGETAPSPVVPSLSTPEENDQSENLENTNSDTFDQTSQRKSPTPSTTSSTNSSMLRQSSSSTSLVSFAGKLVNSVGQTVASRLSRSVSFDSKWGGEPMRGGKDRRLTSAATRGVFDNEVWVWGRGGCGQVGQGDLLDRLQPCPITRLNRLGIVKIATGEKHAVAITVTGRALGWGDNAQKQVVAGSQTAASFSFPQDIGLPEGETARDAVASGNQTVILCDSGRLYHNSDFSSAKLSFTQLHPNKNVRNIVRLSKASLIFSTGGEICKPLNEMRTLEKVFLYRFKEICDKVVSPLCKAQQHNTQDGNSDIVARDRLISSASNMVQAVAQCVHQSWDVLTLEDFTLQESNSSLIAKSESFRKLLKNYIRNVCDCLVADALSLPSSNQQPLSALSASQQYLQTIETVWSEVQGSSNTPLPSSETQLQQLLFYPCDTILPEYLSGLAQLQESVHKFPADWGDSSTQERTRELVDNCKQDLVAAKIYCQSEKSKMRETREFWAKEAGSFPGLKVPSRRVILDSLNTPGLNLSQASSFSKHRFVLFSDVLVHKGYAQSDVHALETVWVEALPTASVTEENAVAEGGRNKSSSPLSLTRKSAHNELSKSQGGEVFSLSLVMPEDNIVLTAASSETKSVWLTSLSKCINSKVVAQSKSRNGDQDEDETAANFTSPPIIRNTSYVFKKIPGMLRNSEYTGTFVQGKAHGKGTVKWLDGLKQYTGYFKQNLRDGPGQMECVDARTGLTTTYKGIWRADQLEGLGRIKFPNGDSFKGMLKNGQPNGHGELKQGRMGKAGPDGVSVYVGEFVSGAKDGYGVLDDISRGEKYMGKWSNGVKSGPGCVVTHDGVYYEGSFSASHGGKMVGRGLAIFEDNAVYEGGFADTGLFSGQGVLTYSSGDSMVGYFDGTYTDGMRFNGTIYKAISDHGPGSKQPPQQPESVSASVSQKIGLFSVGPALKWKPVFSMLGPTGRPSAAGDHTGSKSSPASSWEQLAIQINQNKNYKLSSTDNSSNADKVNAAAWLEGLEMIPDYDVSEMSLTHFIMVRRYLNKAFNSPIHPFSQLLDTLCDCYTATYGGVRIHPLLLTHAVKELSAIVRQLYSMIRTFFPALPKDQVLQIEEAEGDSGRTDCELTDLSIDGVVVVSPTTLIYPIILPKLYPCISMLYVLNWKKNDDQYWERILKWNRHTDVALLAFLEIDQKFWFLEGGADCSGRGDGRKKMSNSRSTLREVNFKDAVETLQQIKTKFTPVDKIGVVVDTVRNINQSIVNHFWSMDELFPVFLYVMVRARIPQMGAEIAMIEDLIIKGGESDSDDSSSALTKGEYGIWFTTMQACYYQILKEPLSMTN